MCIALPFLLVLLSQFNKQPIRLTFSRFSAEEAKKAEVKRKIAEMQQERLKQKTRNNESKNADVAAAEAPSDGRGFILKLSTGRRYTNSLSADLMWFPCDAAYLTGGKLVSWAEAQEFDENFFCKTSFFSRIFFHMRWLWYSVQWQSLFRSFSIV